ncbi:flagellar biosynthetic protein FliO [Klebsiella sp. BIGb0407]|uniref:flagellar biosynthetic protein FliO n=1 Tax=Klebsiella sp. BIGb0407 TaxID=2940603 RepID=UPI0021673049|nr:flagellar biosynthetic protein FliO [Klebsiella sp. BIGb0407]MCS3431522.1 flagellar protein FliO/FliZ [Klebsiella sp. BIGb0407]
MKTQSVALSAPAHTDSPLISVSAALGGIVLLILLAAWIARRFGFMGARMAGKKTLQIRASANLGPRERVVVVDIEDVRLVLGVTASQITHLHTLPQSPENEPPVAQDNSADFQNIMKKLLKRSGKA